MDSLSTFVDWSIGWWYS